MTAQEVGLDEIQRARIERDLHEWKRADDPSMTVSQWERWEEWVDAMDDSELCRTWEDCLGGDP